MCNNILLQNSTFSKIRAFITSKNNSTSLLIDGCTFSEVTAAGQRMFRWREAGQDNITNGIMVKNTLWGTGWDETAAGSTAFDGYDGLGATTWTFENTYATSDLVFAEGKDTIKGFNYTYESLSTDLWVNPAEGNLLFKDGAFAGIGKAGDQRWGIATDDGGVVWNITDTVFSALGTIDTTMTVAGLTVHASSEKSVVVDANNKTVDEMSFKHRMKLGGSGDFDAHGQPLARVLSIDVTGSTQITVAAMSSSSGSDRVLNIAAGHKDILVGEFPALGTSLTMGTYSYSGGPAKLFFYSPSSGVNVYYLKTVRVANSDATLTALSVNTGDLSPVFDPAINSYTLAVPFGTSSVTVNATANDANAMVTGAGDVDVSSGSGTANVVVTAEDGTTTSTYTITITVLTSIEKANERAMFVYPTVSDGIFNIDFAGKPGIIKVYDLTGKLVLQRTAGSSLEKVQLEKAGVYLIRMESENQFRTVRVVSVK
jgi:hypothetical protein